MDGILLFFYGVVFSCSGRGANVIFINILSPLFRESLPSTSSMTVSLYPYLIHRDGRSSSGEAGESGVSGPQLTTNTIYASLHAV